MAINAGQYKTSYQTALTDFKSTDVEGVGCLRIENGLTYKWVLFSTGGDAVASVVRGPVGYLATDTSLHTVCTDYGDCMVLLLAGITLTAAITTGYYCWIQIGGLSGNLVKAITSTGVGKTVTLSADDQLAVIGANTIYPGATVVDIVGGAGAEQVYLTCIK